MKDKDLIRNVKRAWLIEGTNPAFHREQQRHLEQTWPTLYKAIMDIISQVK